VDKIYYYNRIETNGRESMPAKKYIVTLTEDEKNTLKEIINKGKHSAEKRKRAQALLRADENYTDEAIAERAGMSRRGLEQLRQRFVEDGFEATLEGKPRGHRPKALGAKDEARLIALVCSPKPEGRSRWSLRLLQETWKTLAYTDAKTVSYQTIRRTLKKTKLSLGKARNGAYQPGEKAIL
jgi:transposase